VLSSLSTAKNPNVPDDVVKFVLFVVDTPPFNGLILLAFDGSTCDEF
jgi:hypothetical protein